MRVILSALDRHKLLEAYDQRRELLEAYDPDIEQNTIHIESTGSNVARMVVSQQFLAPTLNSFLQAVVSWKMPHKKDELIRMARENSDNLIISAFKQLQDPRLKQSNDVDRSNIEAIANLQGSQVRMASAVLRHLWPFFYGVLDWRNWACRISLLAYCC